MPSPSLSLEREHEYEAGEGSSSSRHIRHSSSMEIASRSLPNLASLADVEVAATAQLELGDVVDANSPGTSASAAAFVPAPWAGARERLASAEWKGKARAAADEGESALADDTDDEDAPDLLKSSTPPIEDSYDAQEPANGAPATATADRAELTPPSSSTTRRRGSSPDSHEHDTPPAASSVAASPSPLKLKKLRIASNDSAASLPGPASAPEARVRHSHGLHDEEIGLGLADVRYGSRVFTPSPTPTLDSDDGHEASTDEERHHHHRQPGTKKARRRSLLSSEAISPDLSSSGEDDDGGEEGEGRTHGDERGERARGEARTGARERGNTITPDGSARRRVDEVEASSPLSPRSEDLSSPTSAAGTPTRSGRRPATVEVAYTLWDYLREELRAKEMDDDEDDDLVEGRDFKAERVENFFMVPRQVEKIMLFGVAICFDAFLYTFTVLPLRAGLALHRLGLVMTGRRRRLRLSHKCDLLKALAAVLAVYILSTRLRPGAQSGLTEAWGKMYHRVRGQETLKLYVIFNVLEIADRLCCSFGQDIQDSLFSRVTLTTSTARPVLLFVLNLAYMVVHTLVLFYQLVTLNVAINSYDNALLTLLISNQFTEIKGSVFKRFEKENLFQMTCADIVERFQLLLMLGIISFRNLIELSSLPFSYASLPSFALLQQKIVGPALVVLASECLVDWLKHAFITKFNHIRPAVYGRFADVLSRDLVISATGEPYSPLVDQSPLVSRRLGFAAVPLACLAIRVTLQAVEVFLDDSSYDECASMGDSPRTSIATWIIIGLLLFLGWASTVALKLIIGINLRAYAATRFASLETRAREEELNGRNRVHIGVSDAERAAERETAKLVNEDARFDVPGKFKLGKGSLMELSRYEMVKSRLW